MISQITICYTITNKLDEQPSFYNLWELDEQANLPDTHSFKIDKIATFNKSTFIKIYGELSKDNIDIKPRTEGVHEYSFVLDCDTLLIGIRYDNEIKRQTGIALVDTTGKLVAHSKNEYYALMNLTSFKNDVYLNYIDRSIPAKERNQNYWNLLFSRYIERSDSKTFNDAYEDLIYAISDVVGIENCFFTTSNYYAFDSNRKSLLTYNPKFRTIDKYELPLDNPILAKITSAENRLEVQFKGVVNNFMVFAASGDWATVLINTKTDEVYIYYSKYISDRFNIIDVSPFSFGSSGYQVFTSERYLYYFVDTVDGSYSLIRVELLN
jgi:hypothetical protein